MRRGIRPTRKRFLTAAAAGSAAAVVERNNKSYAVREVRDVKLLSASLVDKLSRQGVALNAVDQAPFRAPLRPYYEYWARAFGATAWGLVESSLGRKLTSSV